MTGESSGTRRGVALLAVAMLAAGALAAAPVSAGKSLTKKRALKLFYTRARSDSRFVRLAAVDRGSDMFAAAPSATTVTNGVTVTVPTEGVLIVAGSVTVDNDSGAVSYELSYRVDGGPLVTGAHGQAEANFAVGQILQLAFHDGAAVDAGGHTVELLIGGPAAYSYRLARLAVVFVPSPGGTIS